MNIGIDDRVCDRFEGGPGEIVRGFLLTAVDDEFRIGKHVTNGDRERPVRLAGLAEHSDDVGAVEREENAPVDAVDVADWNRPVN